MTRQKPRSSPLALRTARRLPKFSPLYQQIKEHMVNSLQAGEWGPGEVIPSEFELAVRFNVSQGTVRKAIDELAAENFLVRRQGKGTFVATHDDPHNFYRFLRLMPDVGEPKQARSVPLRCELELASEAVARVLQIQQGGPVIHIIRLLSFDGVPVVYDDIYLDAEMFPGLDLPSLKESRRSLYSFFETRFDVRMIRAEERLRAVSAENEAAQALNVKVGEPLLLVERVALTFGDRPVEWRRGYYLTQHHHYLNHLG